MSHTETPNATGRSGAAGMDSRRVAELRELDNLTSLGLAMRSIDTMESGVSHHSPSMPVNSPHSKAASCDTASSVPSCTVRKSYFSAPSTRRAITSKLKLQNSNSFTSRSKASSFSSMFGMGGKRHSHSLSQMKSLSFAPMVGGPLELNSIIPVLTSSLHDVMLDPDMAARPVMTPQQPNCLLYMDFVATKYVGRRVL
jgi:hypothetical protein